MSSVTFACAIPKIYQNSGRGMEVSGTVDVGNPSSRSFSSLDDGVDFNDGLLSSVLLFSMVRRGVQIQGDSKPYATGSPTMECSCTAKYTHLLVSIANP